MSHIPYFSFVRLVRAALSMGTLTLPLQPYDRLIDVSGGCLKPIRREFYTRLPSEKSYFEHAPSWRTEPWDYNRPTGRNIIVKDNPTGQVYDASSWVMYTHKPYWFTACFRCRRCEWCLRQKSRLWRHRALAEVAHAPRTWFVTLTVRPDDRVLALMLSPHDAIPIISRWVTKYHWRMRKAGLRYRYLMVFEEHEDGFPHVHMLIHEKSILSPCTYRAMRERWVHGFFHARLCRGEIDVNYTTKYINKDSSKLARVRASLRYGVPRSLTIAFRRVILDHTLRALRARRAQEP